MASRPGRRVAIVAGLRTPFVKSGTAFKDLSALELGDDDTRALGPTVHLAKPFSRADLLAIIRANLRLDRSPAR